MQYTFSNESSFLILNSHGARIEKLVLHNKEILGTVLREDGKTESTHPCALQHNYDRDGKNKHGKGRASEWHVETKSDGLLATCVLDTVEVSQKFTLVNNTFTLTTTYKNNGNDVATNCAEHNYFVTKYGNDGVAYNDQQVMPKVKQAIASSGFDYIVLPMDEINTITIPTDNTDTHLRIELSQPDTLPFGYVAIWAMGKDTSYICIEPVVGNAQKDFIHSEKAILHASEIQVTQFTLKVLK